MRITRSDIVITAIVVAVLGGGGLGAWQYTKAQRLAECQARARNVVELKSLGKKMRIVNPDFAAYAAEIEPQPCEPPQ